MTEKRLSEMQPVMAKYMRDVRWEVIEVREDGYLKVRQLGNEGRISVVEPSQYEDA
jgi:hypothetical protein